MKKFRFVTKWILSCCQNRIFSVPRNLNRQWIYANYVVLQLTSWLVGFYHMSWQRHQLLVRTLLKKKFYSTFYIPHFSESHSNKTLCHYVIGVILLLKELRKILFFCIIIRPYNALVEIFRKNACERNREGKEKAICSWVKVQHLMQGKSLSIGFEKTLQDIVNIWWPPKIKIKIYF